MRLIDIIKKDVLIVLRDFKALIFIFIMPIVLIVILSLALGGVFEYDSSIGQIDIAVVDNTSASEAEDIEKQMGNYGASFDVSDMSIYNVLDSEDISAFLSYETVDSQEAKRLLDSGETDAIVTIPKGYITGVMTSMMGGNGEVEIDVEGRQNNTLKTQIAAAVVRSYADTLSTLSADINILIDTVLASGNFSQDTFNSIDIAAYMQEAASGAAVNAVKINSQGVEARKPLTSFMYYSIAITCMFILYSAGQGSSFLYTESEEQTLQRLSAAGVTRSRLLFGKSAAVFILCLLQLVVLFAFSTLAFGIDWGNPLAFIVTSICVAISVTGLGVLLMVLVYRAGNPRIGSVFQAILVQVFALFGGSYIPLSVLPKFFSTVSLVTPNGLAIKAYTGGVTGAPFGETLPYLAGSLAIGIVLYLLGVVLFPRERRA